MSAEFLGWVAAEADLPLVEGRDGVVVRANGAACEALGRDPSGGDLVGAAAAIAQVREDDPDLLGLVARASGGGAAAGPVGGPQPWRILAYAPEAGRLQILATPSQLARTAQLERRAAAADVAAGVSHEVANALSAIVGWAQLGQQQKASNAGETFALIEDSARAARSASRRLLDAVRTPSTEDPPSPLDLSLLLSDVARLLGPEARDRRVGLECRVPADLHVVATPSALFTIVWNLLRNAMEALEDGGRISIATSQQDSTTRLVVADDGPGMDEAQRAHAFDPYYTTKPKGTGLGLAMVKQAVEGLGGRIMLETERGRGARFIVELHRAEPPVARKPEQGAEVRRRSGVHGRTEHGNLRVLVVEDDRALREMMHTTLSLNESQVDSVASAGEARALEGPYEVALVDLALTDGRGDRLVAELRRQGVVGAAALVTGATEPADMEPEGEPDLWLRKPFEPSDLLETVRLLGAFGGRDAAQTGDPT